MPACSLVGAWRRPSLPRPCFRGRQINHLGPRVRQCVRERRPALPPSSATRACSCPIIPRPISTVYPRMAAVAPPRGGRTHERMTTMTLFDRHTQGRSQPEPMRDPRAECARRAYLGMAPFYRPEAPNDGGGCSELSAEEILDRLDREARDYALAFMCRDETARFRISGRPQPHHPIGPAAIWLLEATFLLCAGEESNAIAAKLLRLALKQIERPN